MKTEAAKAAKEIKTYLKSIGVKASVKSENYSMGDSVNVYLSNQTPETMTKIKAHCRKYQYGHFDGMTDCYEYTNHRDDIPQTKYLFINNQFSDDMRQAAWQFLRDNYANASEGPELAKDAGNFRLYDDWADTFIYRLLSGSLDNLSIRFWNERTESVAA